MKRTRPNQAIFIKPGKGSDPKQFSRACAVRRAAEPGPFRKQSVAPANQLSLFITTNPRPAVTATTYTVPVGRKKSPNAHVAVQNVKQFNKRPKWGGRASLAPFPSLAGRTQTGADTDVLSPPARTPGARRLLSKAQL